MNHISHEYSQSGQSGDHNTNTRESQRNHNGDGAGLRDESTASDDISNKAQAATRGESSLLKADLISGFHETANYR